MPFVDSNVLPVATGSSFGLVKPDGSSITISNGVLTASFNPTTSSTGAANTVAKFDANGRLAVASNPVNSLEVATKQYVDSAVSGGTVTLTSGSIISALGYTPANQADVSSTPTASKITTYNSSGRLSVLSDPTTALEVATKQYVDAAKLTVGSNITNTANVISLTSTNVTSALGYTPVNSSQTSSTGTANLVAKFDANGRLAVAADPTTALGVATKQYVDAAATTLNAAIADVATTLTVINSLATDYTVSAAHQILVVKLTASAVGSIVLPNSPPAGTRIVIKDGKQNFATYNVTVTAQGTNKIETATTYTLDISRMALTLAYDGEGDWWIV